MQKDFFKDMVVDVGKVATILFFFTGFDEKVGFSELIFDKGFWLPALVGGEGGGVDGAGALFE